MGGSLSSPITTLFIERSGNQYVRTAVASMQGWRLDMEDAHNVVLQLNDEGWMFFGVYDGHGGRKAAQYMASVVPDRFKAEITDMKDHNSITRLMLSLDAAFMESGVDDGTTACMVVAQPWDTEANAPMQLKAGDSIQNSKNLALKLTSINIGDSRAMIVRATGEWLALTEDHKPNDEKEKARIVAAWGHVTNNRVDGNLALSRAIGDRVYKNNPNFNVEDQKVIAVPCYQTHYLYPDDVLLVCCDGIFESDEMTHQRVAMITHESIVDAAEDNPDWDPALIVRNLLEQSLLGDSKDNHTGMLIHFKNGNDLLANLAEKEVVPGPYHRYQNDTTFATAYVKDLKDNGYTLDDVMPMLNVIEADFIQGSKEAQKIKPIKSSTPDAAPGFDSSPMNNFMQMMLVQGMFDEEDDEAQ